MKNGLAPTVLTQDQLNDVGQRLMALTPGGSEYFNKYGDGYAVDVDACLNFIERTKHVRLADRARIAELEKERDIRSKKYFEATGMLVRFREAFGDRYEDFEGTDEQFAKSLTAENERLREALKPFADASDHYKQGEHVDNEHVTVTPLGDVVLRVRDLRAAARALAATTEGRS